MLSIPEGTKEQRAGGSQMCLRAVLPLDDRVDGTGLRRSLSNTDAPTTLASDAAAKPGLE